VSKAANAIVGILLDTSAVTAIVAEKIDRNRIEQGQELPYIIIETENTDPFPSKSGSSAVDEVIINVFMYAGSLTVLDSLTEAVRAALDEKVAGTYHQTEIERIIFSGEGDFEENIENRKVYAVEHSYRVRVVR
jgi:hypothetical protein